MADCGPGADTELPEGHSEEDAVADEMIDQMERAIADVEPIVGAIGRESFALPTPCADFDVRGLIGHLIGGMRGFADVGEGGALSFDLDPDLDTEDALAEYRSAASRLVAAWRAPGAMERTYDMPWGQMLGMQLVGYAFLEVLTHGWDLAKASGLGRTIDSALAEAALASARMWVDEGARTPVLFGPEVAIADDAPAPDRLAAFLGRRP